MSELSNRVKSLLSRFSAATIRAAMAESPAVMQASGWDYTDSGELQQGDPNEEGASRLRKSIGTLGAGVTAATGAGLLSGIGLPASAIGNAVSRISSALQPSKYIDPIARTLGSTVSGGLGSSAYYTGATTLPGVLLDTAADSYFAADAARRLRSSDSPEDIAAGVLDLAPVTAPLSRMSKSLGRALGNIDAYKDLVKDDVFVINKAYDGLDYAKNKYLKRSDLLRGHAESAYPDIPKDVYNSGVLLDNTPYFTIKNRFFGDNGLASGNEIMLNKGAAEYIWTARKDPRRALQLLQGDAAHEGTHWALARLKDNLTIPTRSYYDANPNHPLYADYTSWFDTKKDSWLRSPEEFVSEMTRAQYLNGMPTDRSYRSLSDSERLPIIKELSKTWTGVTDNGIDRMIMGLSNYGYANGGRFFLASEPSGNVPGTLLRVPTMSDIAAPVIESSPVPPAIPTERVTPLVEESTVPYRQEGNPAAPILIPGVVQVDPFDMSGVTPGLDLAEMKMRQRYAESGFRDNLTSKAGAKGRYQIMPITLQEYTERTGKTGDLMDASFNEGIRDWYMDTRLPQFSVMKRGNPTDLVREYRRYAAYNMGPGALNKALTKAEKDGVDIDNTTDWVSYLPKETRDYVSFIVGGQDVADSSKTRLLYEAAKRLRGVKMADGGKIHIAKNKRGTFTAAAKKHGKSVQAFASQVLAHKENYSPAMVKKANFARNAAKWHAEGGLIDRFGVDAVREAVAAFREKHKYDGESEDSQQMNSVVDLSGGRYPITLNYSPVLDDGTMLLSPSSVVAQRSYSLPDLKNVQQVNEQYAYLVEPRVAGRDNTSVSGIPVLPETVLPIGDENDFKISAALGRNMNNEIDKKVASLKSGEDLKIFQQKLVDLGYDLGTYGENHDGVDGKIGRKTRAAARKYYQTLADEAKLNEQLLEEQVIPPVRSADMVQLERLPDIRDTIATADMPLAMTDAITDRERRRNRLTLWPEHAINQVVGKSMGDRGLEAAAEVERTNAAAKQANESGDLFEIAAAKANRRRARGLMKEVPGRKSLTQAERKQAMAILTQLSGGEKFDQSVYERLAAEQGRDALAGEYVGIGSAGYKLSNAREDRDKSIQEYDKKHGYTTIRDEQGNLKVVNSDGSPLTRSQMILRTDNRIYHDPNRGRLGSWSVRIKDGYIEIYDRFEATEAASNIAKGKNDDSGYNETRASWKPGTTHELVARIPLSEYNAFYDSVKHGATT